MNIHSILFATDFSDSNNFALQYASALAADFNATLHIVNVYDATNMGVLAGEPGFAYALAWEDERLAAEEQLKSVLPTTPGVTYAHHCLVGSPVSDLIAFAKEKEIDLIVLASHGRSGLSRLLMGSVAEGVMREASCPVLIVKQPVKVEIPNTVVTTSQQTKLLT